MTPTSEIVLRNGEFVHRSITEFPLGQQNTILASLADSSSIIIPRFADLDIDKLGIFPIATSISRSTLMVATELKELPFNCGFERSPTEPVYVPSFRPGANLGTVTTKTPFPCATLNGRVFFGMEVELSQATNQRTLCNVRRCHLGLILNGEKELRSFSYPNHYEGGNLCMGLQWDQGCGTSLSITGHMIRSLSSFYKTDINGDLINSRTPLMFRKDLNGNWIIPHPSAVVRSTTILSNRFSNALYSTATALL